MYVKFTCRKCGHAIFVSDRGTGTVRVKDLEEVAGLSCPTCGEEGHRNWYLSGVSKEFEGAE